MQRECELETCGQSFESRRSDARYCSASCRATASRRRRAVQKAQTPPTPPPTKRQHLARVVDLEERVEAIEHREDTRTEASKRSLGRLQRDLAELGEAMAAFEGFPEQVQRIHARLSARVDALSERRDPPPHEGPESEQLPELVGRLAQVEKTLTEVGSLSDQLLQVARRVGALDRRITDLDRDVAEALSLVAGLT